MTTNFIRKIVDKVITKEVHNAFTRYSLGEFVKELFIVKVGSKEFNVQTGFEYLNFLHFFLAENWTGEVEVNGTIESVKDLASPLQELGLSFEEKRRFGKSGTKFILPKQTISSTTYGRLVKTFFTEYLLFNVNFSSGSLKVKSQSTPKLGAPTEKFVTLKLPRSLFSSFKEDYLFDLEKADFKKLTIEHTYKIEEIDVDVGLLAKDAPRARREALRSGKINRKIIVDGEMVKEYEIHFKV